MQPGERVERRVVPGEQPDAGVRAGAQPRADRLVGAAGGGQVADAAVGELEGAEVVQHLLERLGLRAGQGAF
ncbi:hypothetical protein [Actinomadura keratinilytica]|uniref:hypothetical protein n=1 Tax=Actinomadura keratinilytica TaxID=547461 RepID=UPI003620DD0B